MANTEQVLKACEQFLQDMHMQEVDRTIAQSIELLPKVRAALTAASAEAAMPYAYQYGTALLWPDDLSDEDKTEAMPLYLAAPQASQPIGQPTRPQSKNWDDDTAHENGHYQNTCAKCNGLFIGYKRRVICAQCAFDSQPVSGAGMTDEEVISRMQAAGFVFGHTQEGELRKFIGTLLDARALLSASGQAVSEKDGITVFDDGERFRWLCEDHDDEYMRRVRDEILSRMSVMSYSAVCQALEHAINGEYPMPASTPAQQTEAPVNVPSGYAIKHVEGHGWLIDPPNGSRWVAYDDTPAGDFFKALAAAPAPAQQDTWLSYVDCECTSDQDKKLHVVSGFRAGQAFNALCRMFGGRWPDAKIEAEAPAAYKFFMELFGSQYPAPAQENAPEGWRDVLHRIRENIEPGALAEQRQHIEGIVQPYLDTVIDELSDLEAAAIASHQKEDKA